MGENSININFGKIDGKKRILTPQDMNGVSKEYLLQMAQGEEGQIQLINTIFSNKDINVNQDNILDNNEWQILQNLLTNDKKVKDGSVKIRKVKNFLNSLGIDKKITSKEDVFRVFNAITNEADEIISINYQDDKTIIQYNNGKTAQYINQNGELVLLNETVETEDTKVTHTYNTETNTITNSIKTDYNNNTTIHTEFIDNQMISRHYNSTEINENNLFAVFVTQGNLKTKFAPDDLEFKYPLEIIENEGLPIQTTTTYTYHENGTYSYTKRNANNEILEQVMPEEDFSIIYEEIDGKKIAKHYSKDDKGDNLFAIFVTEGNIKTQYAPDDTEFKHPLNIIENEGLPNQIETEYQYESNGSYSYTKKDINNNVIESYEYKKNSNDRTETTTLTKYDGNNSTSLTKIIDQNGREFSNITINKTSGDQTISKVYNGDKVDPNRLAAVFITQGNRKTQYAGNDKQFLRPLTIIENEGLVNEIRTQYTYKPDGSYSYTKKGLTSTIEEGRYEKTKDGTVLKIYTGLQIYNEKGKPSVTIKYDNSTPPKIIEKTVREINPSTGEWISIKKYDGEDNLISYIDCKIDGIITHAEQGLGDCYLIVAINSLNSNPIGKNILKENLKISTDSNGNKLYTISFPGAQVAREQLQSKFPDEVNKITIQSEYTITEAEFFEATSNILASRGDGDVLLIELAYKKYRESVNETIENLNINPESLNNIAGFESNINNIEGIDILESGFTDEAKFILTGKGSSIYYNIHAIEGKYGAYIDKETHTIIGMKDIWRKSDLTHPQAITPKQNNVGVRPRMEQIEPAKINLSNLTNTSTGYQSTSLTYEMIDELINEYKDGKSDDYIAEVDMLVSYEQNGEYSLHGMQIVNITDDTVYLLDPNNENFEPYIMSLDEFRYCVRNIIVTKLTE